MASARIQEAQNNLLAAVEINTRLAAIDRRYRTEYLKQVATLEQKLGRKDKAIQAGRDLIAAAPGNPELYEFFSQLCFQLGETEEGLGALRRSVRVNPTEPKGLLLLASALGDQFRTGESIELYWRAFEKAASLDDRLGVVPRLTELYLRTNQFDRIVERLERQRPGTESTARNDHLSGASVSVCGRRRKCKAGTGKTADGRHARYAVVNSIGQAVRIRRRYRSGRQISAAITQGCSWQRGDDASRSASRQIR